MKPSLRAATVRSTCNVKPLRGCPGIVTTTARGRVESQEA